MTKRSKKKLAQTIDPVRVFLTFGQKSLWPQKEKYGRRKAVFKK
jgi:hypothetical protein